MGIYKIPKVIGIGQKPPFGARVNWSHPLSQGLIGAWLFNEGGGTISYDSVWQDKGTITGAYNFVPEGMSFGTHNDAYYITSTKHSLFLCPDEITIFAIINPWSIFIAGTNFFSVLAKRHEPDNNVNYELKIGQDYTAIIRADINFHYEVGGSWHIWTTDNTPGLVINKWQSIGVSFKYGTGSSIIATLDGRNVTASGSWKLGDGNTKPNTDTNNLRIGKSDEPANSSYAGLMRSIFLWKRALTINELQSLNANPYQMFWHPVYDFLLYPAAAPPAGLGKPLIDGCLVNEGVLTQGSIIRC